jgi:hypothetical protein
MPVSGEIPEVEYLDIDDFCITGPADHAFFER